MNIKQLKVSIVAVALLAMTAVSGFAREKYETIDAQAYGTSTQLGKNFTVMVTPPQALPGTRSSRRRHL